MINKGFDPAFGARPLKRYLQSKVETLAAKQILRTDLAPGSTITIDAENGDLVCK